MQTLLPRDIDDDLFMYYESTGKEPKEWEQVAFFDEETDLAVVSINGIHGAVNRNGEAVIPIEYDYAMVRFGEGLLAVKKNNKWGYVDHLNNVIIPFEYDNLIDYLTEIGEFIKHNDSNIGTVDYFSHNKVIAKKNGKIGVIDKENKILIPFLYKRIISWCVDFVVVCNEADKYGTINWENEVIIPFKYDELSTIFENKFICFGEKAVENIEDYDQENRSLLTIKEGSFLKFGIIDINEKLIITAISDTSIKIFNGGKAMCFDFHRDEFFIYDTLTQRKTYAPVELDENKKVNYIRKNIGVEEISF